MGRKYTAKCSSCMHQFQLVKGGGSTWYQKICNVCGKELRVPRNPPFGSEVGVTMTYLDLVKHLNDRSKWTRHGKYEQAELDILHQITAGCDCGGSMISETNPEIVYRCPNCKSHNLLLGEYVLFD